LLKAFIPCFSCGSKTLRKKRFFLKKKSKNKANFSGKQGEILEKQRKEKFQQKLGFGKEQLNISYFFERS